MRITNIITEGHNRQQVRYMIASITANTWGSNVLKSEPHQPNLILCFV